MPVFSAVFLSLFAAIIIAAPAIWSHLRSSGNNAPLLIDVKTFWGHKLTGGEMFWLGMFIHLLMAALFGALYELVALRTGIRPYHLGNLLTYASAFFVFVGGVIFPIVGLGFFGSKEGRWVWFELLVVHHLLGLFMWAMVMIAPSLKP